MASIGGCFRMTAAARWCSITDGCGGGGNSSACCDCGGGWINRRLFPLGGSCEADASGWPLRPFVDTAGGRGAAGIATAMRAAFAS